MGDNNMVILFAKIKTTYYTGENTYTKTEDTRNNFNKLGHFAKKCSLSYSYLVSDDSKISLFPTKVSKYKITVDLVDKSAQVEKQEREHSKKDIDLSASLGSLHLITVGALWWPTVALAFAGVGISMIGKETRMIHGLVGRFEKQESAQAKVNKQQEFLEELKESLEEVNTKQEELSEEMLELPAYESKKVQKIAQRQFNKDNAIRNKDLAKAAKKEKKLTKKIDKLTQKIKNSQTKLDKKINAFETYGNEFAIYMAE